MNTKLTLTLDKEVIEQAKKYASAKGRSLSEVVSNYFKFITESDDVPDLSLSPRTNKLKGILKVDSSFDYKKILDEERVKRYEQ